MEEATGLLVVKMVRVGMEIFYKLSNLRLSKGV